MAPSGMIAFGKMLTAELVQSTIAGTVSIAGSGPWSCLRQSSQPAMPIRSLLLAARTA